MACMRRAEIDEIRKTQLTGNALQCFVRKCRQMTGIRLFTYFLYVHLPETEKSGWNILVLYLGIKNERCHLR